MGDNLEEVEMRVDNLDSQRLHQTAFQLARIGISKSTENGMEKEVTELIKKARIYLNYLFDAAIEQLKREEGEF